MDEDVIRIIQKAAKSEYQPGGGCNPVTRCSPISEAIDAVKAETGLYRREIIWRSVRMYMSAYLETRQQTE